MPQSETSQLEQLVSRHILSKTNPVPLSQTDLLTVTERIRNERIKLESQLAELLCSSQDDMIIRRKLRLSHVRLVQLSNNVYEILKQADQEEVDHPLAKMAMDNINGLMRYAETLAIGYIDTEIPLSHYLVNEWGNRLFNDYSSLESTLKREAVDDVLLQTLSSFYESYHSPVGEMLESQFTYAEKLLRGIHKMILREPVQEWSLKLWELMVYFNFNKKDILAHGAARVRKMGQAHEPYLLVQEKLLTCLKDVRQLEEHPTHMYQRDRISVKAHAITQLEEELQWLQQHRTNLLAEIANSDDNYFIVDLTVRKLNLWAQINVEMGSIPYHSTPHVVKVMANYVRTLKPGPISYESARRKLDAYDPTTVKGLHSWLSRQVAYLEKKFPEQLNYQI